jgi:hypothetical protein
LRTARSADGRNVAAKLAAATGALSLVLAFAIASLMNPFLSLAQLLTTQAPLWMASVAHAEHTGVALWLWDYVALPLLLRPAWMIPTMLGVVLVGLAAQLAWGSRR